MTQSSTIIQQKSRSLSTPQCNFWYGCFNYRLITLMVLSFVLGSWVIDVLCKFFLKKRGHQFKKSADMKTSLVWQLKVLSCAKIALNQNLKWTFNWHEVYTRDIKSTSSFIISYNFSNFDLHWSIFSLLCLIYRISANIRRMKMPLLWPFWDIHCLFYDYYVSKVTRINPNSISMKKSQ